MSHAASAVTLGSRRKGLSHGRSSANAPGALSYSSESMTAALTIPLLHADDVLIVWEPAAASHASERIGRQGTIPNVRASAVSLPSPSTQSRRRRRRPRLLSDQSERHPSPPSSVPVRALPLALDEAAVSLVDRCPPFECSASVSRASHCSSTVPFPGSPCLPVVVGQQARHSTMSTCSFPVLVSRLSVKQARVTPTLQKGRIA